MINPRFGTNLETYYFSQNCHLSRISIYSLGIEVISKLRIVHSAGYVYNDVKLDNIMTGFDQKLPEEFTHDNCFASVNLFLIDYGFATSYIDKNNGKLLQKVQLENFRGNMQFGS